MMINSSVQVGEDLIREEQMNLGNVLAPSSVDLVVRRDLVDNLLEMDLKAESMSCSQQTLLVSDLLDTALGDLSPVVASWSARENFPPIFLAF